MMINPVLVTGAAGGIGSATVKRLIEDGFFVVIAGRNEKELKQAAETYGDKCQWVIADLSNLDEIPAVIHSINEKHGKIRGLVHAAGIDKLMPLYLTKKGIVESLFQIHTMSAIMLCSQIAKKNMATKDCSIVLISSLAAHEGAMGHTAYAAAKGALEGFLSSAAAELAVNGIRINIVVPGIVQTKMSDSYLKKMDEAQLQALNRSYPFGIGHPEDVANAIAFFVGKESRWITGQKLVLDGGHSCRQV